MVCFVREYFFRLGQLPSLGQSMGMLRLECYYHPELYGPRDEIIFFGKQIVLLEKVTKQMFRVFVFPLFKLMYNRFTSRCMNHHCVFVIEYVVKNSGLLRQQQHLFTLGPFQSLHIGPHWLSGHALRASRTILWNLELLNRSVKHKRAIVLIGARSLPAISSYMCADLRSPLVLGCPD